MVESLQSSIESIQTNKRPISSSSLLYSSEQDIPAGIPFQTSQARRPSNLLPA